MREHPVAGKAVLCDLGLSGFLDRRWESTAEAPKTQRKTNDPYISDRLLLAQPLWV